MLSFITIFMLSDAATRETKKKELRNNHKLTSIILWKFPFTIFLLQLSVYTHIRHEKAATKFASFSVFCFWVRRTKKHPKFSTRSRMSHIFRNMSSYATYCNLALFRACVGSELVSISNAANVTALALTMKSCVIFRFIFHTFHYLHIFPTCLERHIFP